MAVAQATRIVRAGWAWCACATWVAPAVAAPIRDLPDSYTPGGTFTVAITLNTPGGTSVVGAEDAPPAGWTVSNIDNGGSLDAGTGKVKWGPFFSPSIPASLSYDVTPPASGGGDVCFAGTASFDGLEEAIAGDGCITRSIPAASAWGLLVLALAIAALGSARMRALHAATAGPPP
jgi:hypothetical protein